MSTEPNGETTFSQAELEADNAAYAALLAEDEQANPTGDDTEASAGGESSGASDGAAGGEETGEASDGAGAQGGESDSQAGDTGGEKSGEVDGDKKNADILASYQTAMKAEREKRQALEAEMREIKEAINQARNARQKEAEPTLEDDPVAYFEHRDRQRQAELEQLREEYGTDREARQAADAEQQFVRDIQMDEQRFAQQNPDYFDAANHLTGVRLEQLGFLYPDGPATDARAQEFFGNPNATAADLRQEHLNQEVQMYAKQARASGQNPASVFYNLAKANGFAGKAKGGEQPAPEQRKVPLEEKVKQARAGAERSQSLSGAGGGAGNASNASIAELTDLALSDPEKFDEMFDKLSEAGALG